MNKLFAFSVVSFLLAFGAWQNANAGVINKAAARQIADQFAQQKGIALKTEEPRLAPRRAAANSRQPLYVFNMTGDNGFVIVAGDDQATPVLGYSLQGSFDEATLPDNFKAWLEQVAAEVEMLSASGTPSAQTPLHVNSHPAIAPLIQTTWDQGYPVEGGYIYNTLVPEIDGRRCHAGCVPTAGAQIMYYYQHPKDYTLPVNGYKSDLAETSAQLPPIRFKWEQMKTSYSSEDQNTESALAVSELMLYCGWAAKTEYGLGGSSASEGVLTKGMVKYFDYDEYSLKYIERSMYTVAEWDAIIYTELQQRRPVIVSGDSDDSGHAFICDGYDGNGLYHFNWGWGGLYDGFFTLQATNPYGTNRLDHYGYIYEQTAVIGIQPNTGIVQVPEGMVASVRDLSVEGTKINMSMHNYNEVDCYFGFGIAELLDDGSMKILNTSYAYYDNSKLPPNYYFSDIRYDLASCNLAEGTHDIVAISRLKGEDTWRRCTPYSSFFTANVAKDGSMDIVIHPLQSLELADIELPDSRLIGKVQTVVAKVKNNAADDFIKPLCLFASKTDDMGTCVYKAGTAIESGETGDVVFYFTPQEEGDWNLWVATDEEGTDIVGRKTVTFYSLKTQSFEVKGCKIANVKQNVELTIENPGGTSSEDLYLFASQTGEKSRKATNEGVVLQPGSTTTTTFSFTPQSAGTWYLWVGTDWRGDNIIAQTETVINEAPQGRVTLKEVSADIAYAANSVCITVTVENTGETTNYQGLYGELKEGDTTITFLRGDPVTIEPGQTGQGTVVFENLEHGKEYTIEYYYFPTCTSYYVSYLGRCTVSLPQAGQLVVTLIDGSEQALSPAGQAGDESTADVVATFSDGCINGIPLYRVYDLHFTQDENLMISAVPATSGTFGNGTDVLEIWKKDGSTMQMAVSSIQQMTYNGGSLLFDTTDGNVAVSALDVEKITFTASLPDYDVDEMWYLTGNDVADGSWNSIVPMASIPMYTQDAAGSVLTYTGYFAGNGFKLKGEDWYRQWGAYGGFEYFARNDGNSQNIEVPSPGYYTITEHGSLDIQEATGLVPADYTTIEIAGTFDEWAGTAMQRVPGANSHDWYIILTLSDNDEVKFKANGSWDINWGSNIFPSSQGYANGENIKVKGGTYIVLFNDLTGHYHFFDPQNPNGSPYKPLEFDMTLTPVYQEIDLATFAEPDVELFAEEELPFSSLVGSYITLERRVTLAYGSETLELGGYKTVSTERLKDFLKGRIGTVELKVLVTSYVKVKGYREIYHGQTTINFKMPEVNLPDFVYFIGATDGWSEANQKLAREGSGSVYRGFCYLTDPNGWGMEFKFQRERGNWDTQLTANDLTCSGDIYGIADSNANFAAKEGEGVYYFEIDLDNKTILGTKVMQMSIIGGFSSWAGDVDMVWDATRYCYTATGSFADEIGWKFRINHDWSINLGGTADNLYYDGANLIEPATSVELYPTRRDSDNIYCVITSEGEKADVNGDGNVDVADIATIIDVMASVGIDPSVYQQSDVNGDGNVDVADIATVIDRMAELARRSNPMK